MIVSIDIGTSYSSICRLGPDGRAQPVDISTGASMFGSKYSLPSAVFVEDSGNVLVGQAAMNSRKHRPQNFRMEFKRNLGEDVPILLGERSFLPEDLYTELFRHMKACAETVDGEQVERAFLTYPAFYGKKRKEKLCAAAKAAGLFDLELVDEPTAAAMCYCAEGYIEDGQTLLVYDFGGGTFDVSVIRYKDGEFRLLAEPKGLERCGGMDIDYLIAKDMWETVGREAPDGLEALEKNRNRHMRFTSQLNELAVKAKHHLSAAAVFEEYIEIGADDVCYRLTAERFNEMAAPLIGQTIQTCRHALEEAGVSASELSAVLLVGGTSRIPLVKEMAQKISGKQPLCAADLELAVAQGALEYCIYQERDKARREEEAKAKERERQEAEEKKRKEQEAAKKKAQQEAEEKKRRKQEEEVRERERQVKAEKDREWAKYLEKQKQKERRDLERIQRRREEEEKERERQEVEKKERECQEKEEKDREWAKYLEKQKQKERRDLERIQRRREEEEKERACQAEEWLRMGLEAVKRKEWSDAVSWCKKAAELGNVSAMFGLGMFYESGQGVVQNYGQAVHWYKKAAEFGEPNAMNNLGGCYRYGRGVIQDYGQAMYWYRKAAELGHAVAMKNLEGVMDLKLHYPGEETKKLERQGAEIKVVSMKQEKESDREYTLNIVRENQWFLINPPMKVCIDGSRNYSVENGASVQVLLPAGPHEIEIKCSIRKTKVNCMLSSDAQLYLKWNRVTGQIEADIR